MLLASLEILPIALLLAVGLLAAAQRLLLRWYVREIRRMEVPAGHGEAIATYPLA